MIQVPSLTKISKNFSLKEFLDKSSEDVAEAISFEPLFLYLVPWLQQIRESVGAPIKITCFYRNPEDNKSAGGSSNSAHLHGYAVDFAIPSLYDFKADLKKTFTRICSLHPDIRVGYYTETVNYKPFFHIDCGRIYEPKEYPLWQKVS